MHPFYTNDRAVPEKGARIIHAGQRRLPHDSDMGTRSLMGLAGLCASTSGIGRSEMSDVAARQMLEQTTITHSS